LIVVTLDTVLEQMMVLMMVLDSMVRASPTRSTLIALEQMMVLILREQVTILARNACGICWFSRRLSPMTARALTTLMVLLLVLGALLILTVLRFAARVRMKLMVLPLLMVLRFVARVKMKLMMVLPVLMVLRFVARVRMKLRGLPLLLVLRFVARVMMELMALPLLTVLRFWARVTMTLMILQCLSPTVTLMVLALLEQVRGHTDQ
jgi:hypothetical protein